MRIAEIYKSIQGEGFLTGTESLFIRTSGCNLRCWFCDTPYASWKPEGEDLPVPEILWRVDGFDCEHVVVTGGEPMLYAELMPLCRRLRETGRHVTVETAGTLYLPVDCHLMSISPKFASSAPSEVEHPGWNLRHEQTRHAPDVIRAMVRQFPYQFKFVIDSLADVEDVESYLREFPEIDRGRAMLMPQGTDSDSLARVADWLEPYCQENDLLYCPRMQIEWFGLARGT